jgi:hypothetical protein
VRRFVIKLPHEHNRLRETVKLRIQDNSIRLRLTRTEVERLNADGDVTATASFPGGSSLRYAVRRSAAARKLAAQFDAAGITVTIPALTVRDWAETEQVSIEGDETLEGSDTLAILIEKDFACLKPREGADESDMFPHPQDGRESS